MRCSRIPLLRSSRIQRTWLAALFVMSIFPTGAPCEPSISQRQVESAFVLNFIKFIDGIADFEGIKRVCIDNPDLIAPFNLLAQKQEVPVQAHLADLETLATCSVLYLVSPTSMLVKQKGVVLGGPLIIASDTAPCRNDAHIRFSLIDNKVRFAINTYLSKKDGFAVSSKVLVLALKDSGCFD